MNSAQIRALRGTRAPALRPASLIQVRVKRFAVWKRWKTSLILIAASPMPDSSSPTQSSSATRERERAQVAGLLSAVPSGKLSTCTAVPRHRKQWPQSFRLITPFPERKSGAPESRWLPHFSASSQRCNTLSTEERRIATTISALQQRFLSPSTSGQSEANRASCSTDFCLLNSDQTGSAFGSAGADVAAAP